MAEWVLTVRALRQTLGAALTEGAMRLTAEDSEDLAELFWQTFSDEKVVAAEFGEQYALLPDGSYLGATAAGGASGMVTKRLTRYAADYTTATGAQPQLSQYDSGADAPLTVSRAQ